MGRLFIATFIGCFHDYRQGAPNRAFLMSSMGEIWQTLYVLSMAVGGKEMDENRRTSWEKATFYGPHVS